MDSCFTCGNVNCIDLAKPKIKTKKLDIVKHNKELGLWLLDNNFAEEIRNTIIKFIGEAYELGFESGYSECQIVNFIDGENIQETCEVNIDKELCPECGNKLDWTYEIKNNPKVGEDPRIYGVICCNCCYEKYDE